MATYNADNYDVAENFDPTTDSNLGQGIWGGKVRVQVDSYTINAKASGTVINVAKLPKGATFLRGLIVTDGLGSGVTVKLGDSGDDDRYMAATSVASAGAVEANAIAGVGYSLSSDTTLFLTTGGATTVSSDKTIKTVILYSLE